MSDPSEKKHRATYQDVLDTPEHEVAELIDGELHVSPRPAGPHTRVATMLGGVLLQLDGGSGGPGGPGGWTFLDEPELHLGEDVVVPDIAAWREHRLPVVPNDAFLTLAPDWICEVISSSTEKRDRMLKLPLYARAGVSFAWLVQPKLRTIEVYRRQDENWLLLGVHDDVARARLEPFEVVELDLARIWAKVPLPTRASEAAAQYEL